MSVTRRALLGFTVILVIAVSACTAVFAEAAQTRGAMASYRASTEPLRSAVWAIRSDFYAYDDQMNMYVAVLAGGSTTPSSSTTSVSEVAERTHAQAVASRGQLATDLDNTDALARGVGRELVDLLSRVRSDVTAYNGFADRTRVAARAGDVRQAVWLTTVANLAPSDDIMPALEQATALVNRMADVELRDHDRRQAAVELLAAVAGGVLAAVILAMGLGVRRWILRPINVLRLGIAAASGDDASSGARVELPGRDEYAELADAFNGLLDSLDARTAEIHASQQTRQTELEAGFEQQHAAEQESRARAQAAVDETAGTVRGDLEEVRSAVHVVRDAARTIDAKVASADDLTRTVVASARDADRVVVALGDSLRRVGGMAELIAGVADATRLLALNATIEAARVGAAGRGFSVVAVEVKQLATATATSTGEITATIGKLAQDAEEMTATIASMSQALGGFDEATVALKEVAAQQHALVDQLEQTVSDSIGRVESLSSRA